MGDDKILLCQLWERTSARGNVYLSGFLGKARLVGFKGETRADGTAIWDVYLTPGRDQAGRPRTRRQRRRAGGRSTMKCRSEGGCILAQR